jgi:NAD dependent epimerase/dehydratase family enzyme
MTVLTVREIFSISLSQANLEFLTGGGGVLGSGKQPLSWVSLNDVVRAIEFGIEKSSLKGPVNVCAPNPVTNQVFTEALGRCDLEHVYSKLAILSKCEY